MFEAVRKRAEHRRLEANFRVFIAFKPGRRHYGYDLRRETGLRSGRMYPALARLESRGWITSGWDDGPHPRRRAYWLTDEGATESMPKVIP